MVKVVNVRHSIGNTQKCTLNLIDNAGAKRFSELLFIFLLDDTGNESENEKSAILAVIVVVPAILVICLIVFFLYRRRKKRDEHAKLDPGTPRTNPRILGMFPSISVKDHINKLTADDLLKSKISVTDPKQIKQYPVDMIAYEKDLGEGQFGQVFQGEISRRTNKRTD